MAHRLQEGNGFAQQKRRHAAFAANNPPKIIKFVWLNQIIGNIKPFFQAKISRNIILSIIFVIADQVSKLIVINTLSKTKSVEVIKSFFYLTYTNNNGAAFSILTGKRILLIIVTLIVIGILVYYIRKTEIKENINKIALSLVIGGSIGNLIDRIVRGAVVDFLDFKIFGYNYPIFNLADTFIVLGVFLLLIGMFRKDKNNDRRHK